MQLLKWFSLMKEIVMCDENLRLKSLLKVNRLKSLPKVNRQLEFIEASLLVFEKEGGDTYLKSDF